MEAVDVSDWEAFRNNSKSRLTRHEVELISKLHAKYFNHKYKVPCSCSPKQLQQWVNDLNAKYEARDD